MKRVSLFRKAKNAGVNLNAALQTTRTLPRLSEQDERPSKKSRAPKPDDSEVGNGSGHSKSKLDKKESSKVNTKKKPKAQVDLEMMEEELKQLEDPPKTDAEKKLSVSRLSYEFYDVPCEELAQNLLGRILVRQLENGTVVRGRIVETESYLGEIDKASMTFGNRVTPGNIPMYMPPGTIFVYMTYGMYYCFNVSSGGKGAAVLLRALEPLSNADEMQKNRLAMRKAKSKEASKDFRIHELCNGPSKLCAAFQIDRASCKYSLCTWKTMWIEDDPNYSRVDIKIVKTSRIGIDSAGPEWAKKPLRFYILGSASVSKRDKIAEEIVSD